MKRSLRVALREYIENIKTKGFWIGILIFPLMIWGFSELTVLLEEKAIPTRHFILIDHSDDLGAVVEKRIHRINRQREVSQLFEHMMKHGEKAETAPVDLENMEEQLDALLEEVGSSMDELGNPFSASASLTKIADSLPDSFFESELAFEGMKKMMLAQLPEEAPPFLPSENKFEQVQPPEGLIGEGADSAEIEKALKPYLLGEELISHGGEDRDLFALVIIPTDLLETRKGLRFWSTNMANTDLREAVESSLTDEMRSREYTKRNIDTDIIAEVSSLRARSARFDPRKSEGDEKVGIQDQIRQWVPVGFVYLLWIAIFSVAQMLLNNTVEEKSSRVMEVLLSSVTAFELMMGKILGIAAVGTTLICAWIGSLVGILALKAGPEAEWAFDVLGAVLTADLLVPFAIYFFLGYLLYASIFASLGSICNTIKDAQNYMGPVMLILMVPLVTMAFIPEEPNGTLARILSWIPLYTPFVMMNRAAAAPPAFDLWGTSILLLVSVGLMIFAASRIFRMGILRTGQPPRLIELLRWLRRP